MSRIVYDHTDIITKLDAQALTLQQVLQTQAAIMLALQSLAQQETDMAKKLPELVDDLKTRIQSLKDDVAAGKTVSESAVTLINGLLAQNQAFKEQLQAFIDTGATPEAVEALQPIVDAMDTANTETDAQRQALADAVAAGTPSEPQA